MRSSSAPPGSNLPAPRRVPADFFSNFWVLHRNIYPHNLSFLNFLSPKRRLRLCNLAGTGSTSLNSNPAALAGVVCPPLYPSTSTPQLPTLDTVAEFETAILRDDTLVIIDWSATWRVTQECREPRRPPPLWSSPSHQPPSIPMAALPMLLLTPSQVRSLQARRAQAGRTANRAGRLGMHLQSHVRLVRRA